MPLSSELYQRCRAILLRCTEFDSNASLRSVFVTDELHPFRSGLPEAANKNERVDNCLAHLLSKRLSDGQAVLPLFLAALRDRYPVEDALRQELEILYVDVEQKLDAQTTQNELHTETVQTISKKTVAGQPIAKPSEEFDPRLMLEAPGGVVDLESPFYIERQADKKLKRELLRPGTTTTIRAPRQTGKTSLLVRGVDFGHKRGALYVFFDFQMVDETYLQDLDTFLRHMALYIADQLSVESEKVDMVWQTPLSPKERLTRFLEDHVLQNATRPIILAIDEADRLFEATFRQEFFSLIRAWFTRRGYNELWKKLNIAMVISTQPYLLIDDIHQSPFNVGTRIELKDFTAEQVQDLNDRHESPLNEAELEAMLSLLGGHPYLVRQALYTLVDEGMTWPQLEEIAITESGPFSQHLRQYLGYLRDKPGLKQAIKSILTKQSCPDEVILTRLISAGLVQQDEARRCRCRCQLYERYFRRFLL
jgi:hypothetical protein